ncbi:MAG: hypothetical protein VB104_04175 [Candidatus Limiplasma sp.]|nr:hypothetical protein [Candidatus Limiplasma sp.]
MTTLVELLTAVETAQATTDKCWANAGRSEAANAAHDDALDAEEAAIDNAVRELRRLQPELHYHTARALVAIPAERGKLKANYGLKASKGGSAE